MYFLSLIFLLLVFFVAPIVDTDVVVGDAADGAELVHVRIHDFVCPSLIRTPWLLFCCRWKSSLTTLHPQVYSCLTAEIFLYILCPFLPFLSSSNCLQCPALPSPLPNFASFFPSFLLPFFPSFPLSLVLFKRRIRRLMRLVCDWWRKVLFASLLLVVPRLLCPADRKETLLSSPSTTPPPPPPPPPSQPSSPLYTLVWMTLSPQFLLLSSSFGWLVRKFETLLTHPLYRQFKESEAQDFLCILGKCLN